jgi:F0F1-type ATP synthase delta subunit
VAKKYIPIKERNRLFHKKRQALANKIKTDKSLSDQERKKFRKKLSKMGKGSVWTVRG